MRVLWVTENHPPSRGGMAQSSDRIVAGLRGAGVAVDVVQLRRTETASVGPEPRPRRGVGGRHLDVALRPDPEHALHRAWVAVSAMAAEERPTHVVAFGGTHPILAAPVWAAWLDRPLLTLFRGNDLHTGLFSLRRRPIVIEAIRRSAAVCVVSSDDASLVSALEAGAAVHHVANGLDVTGWAALPSEVEAARRWREDHVLADRRLIGVFGQLKAKKGVGLLLRAVARSPVRDHLHLVLVGDLEPGVAAWLEDHPEVARSVVPFLDRYELLSLLPACDAVALPSAYDGLPNVALEALALGRPLLCSTAGGLGDVVAAGDATGSPVAWSFAPGDEVGCAAALAELVAAPGDEVVRRGQAGAALVRHRFTAAAERDGYLAVLAETAAAPDGHR
ncbi:MAG: glycosyltransferase family 4 protein [Acidimicrobiales bacterium]